MTTDGAVDEAWQRPMPDRRRLRIDIAIGVAVTLTALFNLTLTRSAGAFSGHPPPVAEQVVWTVLTTFPLCWRRRWPDAVAVLISAAFIAGQIRYTPEQQLATGSLFAAIYTLGAWGRHHRRAHWIRAGIIAGMFLYLGIPTSSRCRRCLRPSSSTPPARSPRSWPP